MKIKISVDELRQKPFVVGTPAYGGLVSVPYHISINDLTTRCNEMKVPIKNCLIENESLIMRARNNIAHMFMNEDNFPYLMFIDADIKFDVNDVLCLLAVCSKEKYPIIAGSYPKKRVNWDLVHKAVRKGASPGELQHFADSPVMNIVPKDGQLKVNMQEPLEVKETGTGFMMIHKSVFHDLKKHYPNNYYFADYSLGLASFDQSDKKVYDFFPAGIVEDEYIKDGKKIKQKRYLSEDYYFVRNWINTNPQKNKLHILPWINLTHHGTFQYHGNLQKTMYLKSLED